MTEESKKQLVRSIATKHLQQFESGLQQQMLPGVKKSFLKSKDNFIVN